MLLGNGLLLWIKTDIPLRAYLHTPVPNLYRNVLHTENPVHSKPDTILPAFRQSLRHLFCCRKPIHPPPAWSHSFLYLYRRASASGNKSTHHLPMPQAVQTLLTAASGLPMLQNPPAKAFLR
ncbi:MAG: CRISPR-associated protein Cas5 [Anaerotignum lactatifermentans]|uniref:CRISPR-associated protein Cas5 n=1 Tax=Anaerotignum lactatifermentans TaxID=160404 RepID=UPI00399A2601